MSFSTLRVLSFACLALTLAAPSYAADKPKTDKAAAAAPAAVDPYTQVQPAMETLDLAMYQRIRDEGFTHSHVMEFASALMDGPGLARRLEALYLERRQRTAPGPT